MAKQTLQSLGALVRQRRGANRLRETAQVIGISAATLLRVEAGRTPDVVTFGKLCNWLEIEPGAFLGSPVSGDASSMQAKLQISAHHKSDRNPKPETIKALAEMILLAANSRINNF